ncbi:hypothetical protein V8F20_008950 [Naviculisporaceae sp. PSN 640]
MAMRTLQGTFFPRSRRLACLPTILPQSQQTQRHRKFSVKGVYRTTPTDLHCYSPDISSSLFQVETKELKLIHHRRQHLSPLDRAAEALRTDYDDAVIVTGSGLLYPLVTAQNLNRGIPNYSNGALFYPNSADWPTLVHHLHAQFLEDGKNGRRDGSFTPHIFTLPRGTPIPDELVLFHEHIPKFAATSRFSLQPSKGMRLEDLNRVLDEFYSRHASREPVSEWLKRNADTREDESVSGGHVFSPPVVFPFYDKNMDAFDESETAPSMDSGDISSDVGEIFF